MVPGAGMEKPAHVFERKENSGRHCVSAPPIVPPRAWRLFSFTRRSASAERAFPSGVVGPRLVPPCIRQRALRVRGRSCSLSQTAGAMQGSPLRVLAPQRGRLRLLVIQSEGLFLSNRSRSILITRAPSSRLRSVGPVY